MLYPAELRARGCQERQRRDIGASRAARNPPSERRRLPGFVAREMSEDRSVNRALRRNIDALSRRRAEEEAGPRSTSFMSTDWFTAHGS